MKIGVISDTHGLLRPEAVEALRGVDHILHAGDVGKLQIIHSLGDIAPVTAIRGNVDVGGECNDLPDTEAVAARVASCSILFILLGIWTLSRRRRRWRAW